MDFLAAIDAWATRAGDRPAYRSGGRVLTYAELRARSDRLARWICSALPDDHSPVGIVGHKEPEVVVGFLGCAKAGHPYIPIDTAVPEKRLERMLSTADARLVLSVPEIALRSDTDSGVVPARPKPDDPLYVIFTSGSTGEPKGVVIIHACLASFLDWQHAEHCLGRGEVLLNQVAFSFDVSMMDLFLGLTSGSTVFGLTRDDVNNPRDLHAALAASGATVWTSTPSFVQLCLAEPTFRCSTLPRLRRFLFAGEVLSKPTVNAIMDRFPDSEVWNGYGPTEATILATSIRLDRAILDRYPSVPIGYPASRLRVDVLDDALRPVPPGERGQIVIAGPQVSPGYLNRPELTERAFFTLEGQRAYKTGDWGHVSDGMVFYDGRRDGQIKLHGNRVELADIEENVRGVPQVRDAVVVPVARPGESAYAYLAAFVILRTSPASEGEAIAALRAALSERLPAYMLPRKIWIVDSFPMTVNGKADRPRLLESLA